MVALEGTAQFVDDVLVDPEGGVAVIEIMHNTGQYQLNEIDFSNFNDRLFGYYVQVSRYYILGRTLAGRDMYDISTHHISQHQLIWVITDLLQCAMS